MVTAGASTRLSRAKRRRMFGNVAETVRGKHDRLTSLGMMTGPGAYRAVCIAAIARSSDATRAASPGTSVDSISSEAS
jgi:hypothetical protein